MQVLLKCLLRFFSFYIFFLCVLIVVFSSTFYIFWYMCACDWLADAQPQS